MEQPEQAIVDGKLDRIFPREPTPGFYYVTPGLRQRLDLLHHLVRYSEMLLVVVGDSGSGKSAFIHQLVEGQGVEWRVLQPNLHDEISAEGLLRGLLDTLAAGGGEIRSGSTLAVVEQALISHHDKGRQVLIVIDGLELLTPEARDLVVMIAAQHQRLSARVLVSCEHDYLREVQSLCEKHGFGDQNHVVTIPDFTPEQTGDYLHLRVSDAGYSGDSPFTDELIQRVFRESGGRPARIHEISHNLLSSDSDGKRASRRSLVIPRWGPYLGATVLAAMLVLAYVNFGDNPPPAEPTLQPLVIPPRLDLPGTEISAVQPQPGREPTRVTPTIAAQRPPEVAQTDDAAPAEETDADGPPTSLAAAEPGESPEPGFEPDPPTTESEPPPEGPPVPESEPVVVPPAPESEPESVVAPPVPESEPVVAPPVPELQPEPVATPPKVEPKVESKAPQELPREAAINDRNWIWSLPPARYTIQLIGTRSKEASVAYIRKHGIADKAAWFKTKFKGEPWYVVIYGDYPSRQAARRAIRSLPTAARKGPPWARAIADIQNNLVE